ncbi:methyltransferase domain-containing protein [Ditylenchus destructor]|uniref:Methyltransferase domain-containing protein n=1 Tax=Ditylenchus destructor TaxID=166010 RepID=A0AAD4QZ10_9BILA|nr:methyltransferase domain-containing protein [Ditylenchus destructor]
MFGDRENDYTDVNYWDKRFEDEAEYEWIANFDQCSRLIVPHLKPDHRILHLGCGNSKLSYQLSQAGFPNVTNVDYSSCLIGKLSKENSVHFANMDWVCDDIRTLEKLEDSTFDMVIEKAVIESLLANEKSVWTLSDSAKADLRSTLVAVHRVLKPGGLFISISFTPPYFRVPHLVEPNFWDCEVEEFGDGGFHFYCYRMRKGQKPDVEHLEKYLRVTR